MNIVTLLQNPVIISEVTKALKENPQTALQIFKVAAPELVTHLDQIRDAIYKGTSREEQLFISANLSTFSAFLQSKPGAEAISEFVSKWADHILPPKPVDKPIEEEAAK